MTFRVLHVCTGNICRSPMAEHLMRQGLADRGVVGIDVASAGTRGLVDHPVQELAAAQLTERGVTSADFLARRLVAELVESADLVLAASREHRAAAVTLFPRAATRTFTLREFDRLLGDADTQALPVDPEQRAQALVLAAASRRGYARADRPEDDDITDPYGGPAKGYLVCAGLIEATLQRWLDLMTPLG